MYVCDTIIYMNPLLFIAIIAVQFSVSLFLHSFFLHRYATHRQFTMSRFWERIFFILTWLFQGPSFLNPKSYAKMHLEHHAHSDTPDDPHSPHNFSKSRYGFDFPYASMKMMFFTKHIFEEIKSGTHKIASMYTDRTFPEWKDFEDFTNTTISLLFTGLLFILFYYYFASGWLWLLLPITLLNAPIQGALVNWCGHMWGYRNYNLPDKSRNTWVLAPLMWGELYQNNHHNDPDNPNFGGPRWYELDPLYPVIIILEKVSIIKRVSCSSSK